MSTRILLVLGATAAVVAVAVATRPGPPAAGPIIAVADSSGGSSDGAATAGDGAGFSAGRPTEPTGKPGGLDAPPFTGAIRADDVPVLGDAPKLIGIESWLQNDGPETIEEMIGEVVVVQFWTFSCSNCKATLPNLQALRDAHTDDGLRIVGVHYPEFSFEEDPAAVADAAAELGVTWPIALDTDGRSFHGWQEGTTGFWPRTYVIDRQGRVRFDHVGEGRYAELNATVAALLAEPA